LVTLPDCTSRRGCVRGVAFVLLPGEEAEMCV